MLTAKTNRIKIENPCPMKLGRLKKDSGFYCNSCDKIIVDFRDKTVEEIVKVISGKTVCGIFNNEQIVKPEFSFKRGLLFKALTVLAFLGFNVKPLHAQTKPVMVRDSSSTHQAKTLGNNDVTKIEINDTTQETLKIEKRKWWQKKKKPKYRTTGCPSF